MSRLDFNILFALLTFLIGISFTSEFLRPRIAPSVVTSETILTDKTLKIESPAITTDPSENSLANKCEEWSDEIDFAPILRKWLQGERLKNIPYCSETGEEATGFNPSNVMPTLIDLNSDGKKEIALQSGCSPTGNCSMEVFQRKGRRYRKIFTDIHGVQVFGLRKSSNKGYHDVWARMHGSWNSGDMVFYRFDGNKYKPTKCFYYDYKEYQVKDGQPKARDIPTLTPAPCSRFS